MKRLILTNEGNRGVFFTIQGEGRYAGVPTVFIRASQCNLRCEWVNEDGTTTKCDTPLSSWRPERNIRLVDDIINQVVAFNCKHVVVTGGEPFLQKNVVDLIDLLVDRGYYITVETNGTIYRPTKAQFISISPKFESCNPTKKLLIRSMCNTIPQFLSHHDYQIKFVINSKADIAAVVAWTGQYEVLCDRVYLMPQCITDEEMKKKASWIVEVCKDLKFNFCMRQHIWLYGQKKGV